MANKLILFTLALFLLLSSLNCHSRYKLKRIEPSEKWVNKTIEIQTKDGSKYTFLSYKITSKKIIGKDESGKEYSVLIENVKNFIVVRKLSAKQQIPIVLFTGVVTVGLLLFLSLKDFDLR